MAGQVGPTSVSDAFGGDKGRQEALLIFLCALGDLLGIADIGAKNDLDRTLGAHHGNLCRGPCIVEIATQML